MWPTLVVVASAILALAVGLWGVISGVYYLFFNMESRFARQRKLDERFSRHWSNKKFGPFDPRSEKSIRRFACLDTAITIGSGAILVSMGVFLLLQTWQRLSVP